MNASKIVRWENGCPNHTTAAKFQIESHKLKPVLEVIQLGKHPKESLLEDYCNRIGVHLIHTQLPEQSPTLQAIRAN